MLPGTTARTPTTHPAGVLSVGVMALGFLLQPKRQFSHVRTQQLG
jgi:hypothetical protein